MKRCPECRRDYYDDSLLYCLDDGTALLEGPGSAQEKTAIFASHTSEAPTRHFDAVPKRSGRLLSSLIWIVTGGLVIAGVGGYFLYERLNRPYLQGSFRSADSAAYDYYLRGKLDAKTENSERNGNAIKILETVVATDPTFAPAYAELARAYSIKANYWAPEAEKAVIYEKAHFAVEKALALDPNLAEGHFVRAVVIWTAAEHFPHELAIQSLKRAIALDPNLAEAHHQLGVIYYHIGLLDKGEQELRKALEIDPTDAAARLRLGLIDAYRTNYVRALETFKTVPVGANPAIVNRAVATVLLNLGRDKEASTMIDEFLAKNPDEGGNVTSVKAILLAKEGLNTEAEATINHAIDIGRNFQHFHHTTYNLAIAYALLNKPIQAMKWLEYTADDGFPCYPLFERDPNLDNLRQGEQFKSLLFKMKQRWERYAATL